ncbi:nuclear transport factor 2 family protein [Sphingobacterium hungaricum]|uniref:Lumazine-binding n=1 Tax=Sphingobacterium hungaricum TaxID=2082723 RepID=A0A928UX11_9SPHI|nr:nuclear transport factor 2 family protein [Sphingobacterium hungaricum]MBE8712322.1 hypothetical protein [Sphingobacterium hungaricum]
MKNLIKTIAFLSFLVFSMSSFAKTANPYKNASAPSIVDSYIQAVSMGNTKYSKYLFTEDFKFIQANKNSKQYNKKELTAFLKKQEGFIMNCETSYKIIEQNKDFSVAKVTMVFPSFTRTDYVTLSNSDKTWAITQVVTTFDNSRSFFQ